MKTQDSKKRAILESFKNGLIVSCQVQWDDPIYTDDMVVKMAEGARWAGAVGIRANSPEQIRAIKEKVDLPMIGLYKIWHDDTDVFITPTLYGYTKETASIEYPDLREFARMCRDMGDEAYFVMEGHIYSPEDAIKCLYLGAHSVVVGSAITRPHLTAKRFVDLMSGYQNNWRDAEKSKHQKK